MIEPMRAAVKPRVRSPESGLVLPLEDVVFDRLEHRVSGRMRIVGGPGAGKTTALQHLASVLPVTAGVEFRDDADSDAPRPVAANRLIILTASQTSQNDERSGEDYRLVPWGNDELIEFLLAVHKERCGAVMSRITIADRATFRGIPELWQIVLDRLARDPVVPDSKTAFRRHLLELMPETDAYERARIACLAHQTGGAHSSAATEGPLTEFGSTNEIARVLRHSAVQVLMSAEQIVADLRRQACCEYLRARLPFDVVWSTASLIERDDAAIASLRALLRGHESNHAMAASLLHGTGGNWMPEPGSCLHLNGAYLEGAAWSGVRLPRAQLDGADLSGADLRNAQLDAATACKSNFRGAKMMGSSLSGIAGQGADWSGTDLSGVRAPNARFDAANLSGANLQKAELANSCFMASDLSGATFAGADLTNCTFSHAQIADTDFSGANLERAMMSGLKLREATIAGARFAKAQLLNCDLEGVALTGADFESAHLTGALLTATSMPSANFANACLRNTGLADIHWPRACLRGADLRGACFHLGSSRSGLVNSPLASEGTRTGFYTDDFDEQAFKSPEEIRKANLYGADLRDARIDDVDFYLVDLRFAQYSRRQEQHFRRCKAILENSSNEL